MSKTRIAVTDKRLLMIKHLYGEEVCPEKLNELLEDPECQVAFEKFIRVKTQLENPALRRRKTVPDDVVNRVFASAARPRLRRVWSMPVRRPKRLTIVGGAVAAAACVLFLWFISVPQNDVPEAEPPATSEELQWDDTQDRIEMQQALSVVRQRTSPELWDESAVMKLDSLRLDSGPSGVETASAVPQ